MRATLTVIICIGIIASSAAGARAQSSRRPQDRAARTRTKKAAGETGGADTFAARRAQYAALLQLRASTRKYLDTLAPGSAEHAATAQSLHDLENRVAATEKSLLALFAASTADEGAAQDDPAPAPADDAEVSETVTETPVETPAPARRNAARTKTKTAPAPAADTRDNGATDTGTADTAADTAPTDNAATGGAGAQDEEEEPTPTPTPAPVGIVEWLNNRVAEKTVALINQGSNSNQIEVPAATESSTALVDQSSASDLVGVALNLAGLSAGTNDDKDVTSAAVTASAYSFYAAFKGADPLDPAFYNRHKDWRRFSFTLGFENEKKDEDGDETDRVTLAGFKWLIFDGRDAADNRNVAQTRRIITALREAAGSFARLDEEITGFLFRSKSVRESEFFRLAFREYLDERARMLNARIAAEQKNLAGPDRQLTAAEQQELAALEAKVKAGQTLRSSEERRLLLLRPRQRASERIRADQIELAEIERLKKRKFELVLLPDRESEWTATEVNFAREGFTNKVLQGADSFVRVRAALTEEERETLDRYVDTHIDPFVRLRGETRRALEQIRSRPQLSFSFLNKRRRDGDDEYTTNLIYDRGLGTRNFATLNAGFKYRDSKLVGGDKRGGNLSGQLQFQVTPEESLLSKDPLYLTFSGNAEWLSGVKPKYRAQAKVKFPVADGITFPVSFTVANRTDLIDEMDVRGQFGFTFDTAKLFRAFRFKLPALGSRPLAFTPLALPKSDQQ